MAGVGDGVRFETRACEWWERGAGAELVREHVDKKVEHKLRPDPERVTRRFESGGNQKHAARH